MIATTVSIRLVGMKYVIPRTMVVSKLGRFSLQAMNEALKTKGLWRFAAEDDALCEKVIVSKYGIDNLSW